MSTFVNDVKFTLVYGDGTSRTYTLPSVPDDNLEGIRGRVQQINEQLKLAIDGGSTLPGVNQFHATFVGTTADNKTAAEVYADQTRYGVEEIFETQIISTEIVVLYTIN